jgi:hypothetical protein
MSKTASQRRFDKRAIELGALFRSDPNAFSRVWEQYVRGWLVEIGNRARAQRSGETGERHLRIFEVLTLAQRIAHATGAKSQVGNSLIVLEHECAKAVANLTDPRMYLFNEDCTTRIRDKSLKSRTRG